MIALAGLTMALAGTPALADNLLCQLHPDCTSCGTTVQLGFHIDRNQFSPPVDAGEPPRRMVTHVMQGDTSFQAEPMLLANGVRGFWADINDTSYLLTIQPDGTATYTVTGPRAASLVGTCKDTP